MLARAFYIDGSHGGPLLHIDRGNAAFVRLQLVRLPTLIEGESHCLEIYHPNVATIVDVFNLPDFASNQGAGTFPWGGEHRKSVGHNGFPDILILQSCGSRSGITSL